MATPMKEDRQKAIKTGSRKIYSLPDRPLEKFREEFGLTYRQTGDFLGLSMDQVRKIIKGDRGQTRQTSICIWLMTEFLRKRISATANKRMANLSLGEDLDRVIESLGTINEETPEQKMPTQ